MSPVIAGGNIIEGSQPFEDKTASFTIGGARTSRVTPAAAVTATLPAVADNKDREFTIINISGAYAVTVTDGGSFSVGLTEAYEKVDVYSNGTAWVAK